ncbi:MAG: septum formation initiator family protein [Gammaproteobacteria bacterium]|jgi:cell division protein FtsB|nr:septum formation initiator family protein [Gammaproteobacteria bacterium]
MRFAVVVLVALLALLQMRLWVSADGFRGVAQLRSQVAAQANENRDLTERNRRLEAEVADLRQGFSALEERARADLGLIAPNESFYIYAERPRRGPEAGAR